MTFTLTDAERLMKVIEGVDTALTWLDVEMARLQRALDAGIELPTIWKAKEGHDFFSRFGRRTRLRPANPNAQDVSVSLATAQAMDYVRILWMAGGIDR